MTAASAQVAERAIAGLLLLARRFPPRFAAQREHRWLQLRRAEAPADLAGQTLLLIGLGAAGTRIARFARALDMRVLAVRPSPACGGEPVDELHPPAALDALLPRAQWLVPACPCTDTTRGLIDARRLALLPRGAGLVNAARRGLVDEGALVAALAAATLAHACIDTGDDDALPADSPLRALTNVLLAPAAPAA